ncbi:MAG: CbtA family protein [Actinomycetes bacterium]
MPSARSFLLRGLLAGLIAGFAAFGVAYVAGEPALSAAITVEEDAAGHSHDGEETLVPRSLQSTLGLLTGTALAGTTLGGLAGVVSALALGRFGSLSVRGTCVAVAAVGLVSLTLVPFAVYPPNPPAVGSADTIGLRSALYVILVAISVIAAVTAVLVGRRLSLRWGAWAAGLAAVGGYLATVVVVSLLLPRYAEVPAGFPAAVLYDFRLASLLTQVTLWAVLGVVLAELVHRRTRAVPASPRPYAAPVAR